jgi:flagellin FlaB
MRRRLQSAREKSLMQDNLVSKGKGKKMNMWFKKIRRFARNKKAISGLETAIVLIAFVIVASAFAYAVLNMGFLATQKSQQVVLGGLQGASAAMVVDGPVYGYGSNDIYNGANNYTMHTVIFWLKVSSGADSVDLNVNKTTIGYQNPRGVWPNIYNTGGATLSYTVGGITYTAGLGTVNAQGQVQNGKSAATAVWEVGSGNLLKTNDKVRVTIDLTLLQITTDQGYSASGTFLSQFGVSGLVYQNEQFKIIVKPPYGSVLDIVRNAPAQITQTNDLS